MKKYYCNPMNVPYRYQFNMDPRTHGKLQIDREGADPSMILFHGKYYLFASMNLSVWVSEDLVHWESYRLPENLPLYDYAPDARVCGDYVYFCASKKGTVCNYYRTKDIINGPYEEIPGTFDFWDPNLFFDEDGKIYFYWGCSNQTPVWGVELEPETMKPKTEWKELLFGDGYCRGYERMGEDHCEFPRSDEEVEVMFQAFVRQSQMPEESIPKVYIPAIKGMFTRRPFIEGPWMDKYEGRYYLQYACPGTEYNGYADGVYVAEHPLGPFILAKNNPYSYHPGGFMPGAGHGSTMRDLQQNLWHTATMRISVNHQFERRVGLWPAGFDSDGELFCNQNYGDWPIAVEDGKMDPWKEPEWFLLNYAKPAKASSFVKGKEPEKAFDENAKTWWRAADSESGQWLETDLGTVMDVRAIQINFADDALPIASPGKIQGSETQPRYIEERELVTRWKLEGSLDGAEYFMIEDKSKVDTDLPHDLVVREEGLQVRYLRLTIVEIPYHVEPCISGFRVFGKGAGDKPVSPKYHAVKSEDGLDLLVSIGETADAIGYNILWGHEKRKLYHSYQIYRNPESVQKAVEQQIEKRIGALVKEQECFVRVDSYNENGITHGTVKKVLERK